MMEVNEFTTQLLSIVTQEGVSIDLVVRDLLELIVRLDRGLCAKLTNLHIAVSEAVEAKLRVSAPEEVLAFNRRSLLVYHLLLRQELLAEGEVSTAVLRQVTEREIAADRMHGDDPLRSYATGGRYVGSPH